MNHYLRTGQQKPAPERILEIQRALSAKGYLAGEVDGNWDDRTTDALKRFQAQQSLSSDGKISALSLIALGLGPSRGVAPPATKPDLPPAIASARAALAMPQPPATIGQE